MRRASTFAYIDDDGCDGMPAIIAATVDGNYYDAALGTDGTDRRVGYIADPVISADGSHVAWTTTVPAFDYGPTPRGELPAPVIRMQEVGWWDSRTIVALLGADSADWSDLAEGAQVVALGIRAHGRLQRPRHRPPYRVRDGHALARRPVRHQHAGSLGTPGFMTAIEIPSIPLTSLRGYAAAIANAPIHRLPDPPTADPPPAHPPPAHPPAADHDSPIHHLPIHRLPIHHLPIHRLDTPRRVGAGARRHALRR